MSYKVASSDFLYADFVPQAELYVPESEIVKRLQMTEGSDDLDYFVGAAVQIDRELTFTLKHYKGFPKDVYCIYFEKNPDMGAVQFWIEEILSNLELPRSVVKWSRPEDPNA